MKNGHLFDSACFTRVDLCSAANVIKPETNEFPRHAKKHKGNNAEKKGLKACKKLKYDKLFQTASFAGPSSGLSGLKHNVRDVTSLVRDISMNDLLHGTCDEYTKSSRSIDDGIVTLDSILPSIERACSLLSSEHRPAARDIETVPPCTSDCRVTDYEGIGDSSTRDLTSLLKAGPGPSSSDGYIDEPKKILGHLTLPSGKDLESMLVDADNPPVSSKSGHGSRVNQAHRRPPFPWSYSYNMNSRPDPETNKVTCQGAWSRYDNGLDLLAPSTRFLDLDPFTYNEALVPLIINAPCLESEPLCPAFLVRSHGSEVEQCPRILAAARILCDIATSASNLAPGLALKWPHELSRKSLMAPKPIHGNLPSLGTSKEASTREISPPKKPKLPRLIANRGHLKPRPSPRPRVSPVS